jgi:hypothetical protein
VLNVQIEKVKHVYASRASLLNPLSKKVNLNKKCLLSDIDWRVHGSELIVYEAQIKRSALLRFYKSCMSSLRTAYATNM